MRNLSFTLILLFSNSFLHSQPITVQDDFEGNGTITTWAEDDCILNTSFDNPHPTDLNSSATVLRYHDVGGQYANVRFDVPINFNLGTHHTFSLKIYIPSSGLTGNQANQVSLKLQDGSLTSPWSTQSEIIKPLQLDQWQEVSFDFENDPYRNLDSNSLPPTQRNDFNRVLIQVNGEDNTDQVIAYIDDISYDGTLPAPPVFDQLIWSDEFDTDGPLNASKWFQQNRLPNGESWFNGEIQHYTNRVDNAFVENGVLKILAKRESYTDQGITKNFTSARLNSKFAFRYGKVEVRAKLPSGVGTWPAIWMLGKNIDENGAYWETLGYGTTPWPACGEIDIMEHWGANQNVVSSAIHTPSSFGGTVNVGEQHIPTASTAFHTYTVEWTAEKMVFKVDGVTHLTYNPPVKNASTWPFDLEQYILLNVAILPNIAPSFTSSAMEIDYVRVYQQSATSIQEVDEAQSITLYPNPFSEELRVQLKEPLSQEAEVKVYSLGGELMGSYPFLVNGTELRINNLEDLSKGIYLIEVDFGEERYSLKVLKE